MKKFRNDKLLVSTPRGQIIERRYTKGKNKGKLYARIEWTPGFGPKRTADLQGAQAFVDSEVLRYSDPYIPFRTGMLKASGKLGTEIGSGEVVWVAPYAAAQYYDTADSRPYDDQRGGHWFERMKADHGADIIRGAKKIGGGNG